MCGIAGFLASGYPELNTSALEEMGHSIAHRGPDATATFLDENIGLVHRQNLSIIDLSEAGIQPMFSTDRRCAIVFNGEIYNFPVLRQSMLSLGYEFTSNTDTEVILALYQQYGVSCLEHLNGMFAFALWDFDRKAPIHRSRPIR